MAEQHSDAGAAQAEAGDRGGLPRHLKRYGVVYAVAIVIVGVLVVLPALDGDDGDEEATGPDAEPTEAPAAGGDWRPASGDLVHGTGTTRTGVDCEPGVPQVDFTAYGPPCLPEFDGDNGGATYRGVTADTIRIVVREFPATANSEALDRELEAAGFATSEVSQAIRDRFIEHMNDTYELYGRRVELVTYESRFGNATAEALGQGREGACQDATLIVEELGAYGVVGGSAVFSECAAERGLVVFGGGAYYPESWYADLHPYVWNTTMNCEYIAAQVAEYVAKRLHGRPAVHAGDPALRTRTRVFGSYSPDNEQYVHCNELTGQIMREEYGVEQGLVVRYALDISRFAEQAARAVVQWKAEGVTTVVLAADPISIGMLTSSATEQEYFPEWVIIGTAGMDTDNFGRSYDQRHADGHMFGISHLNATEMIYGPGTEPGNLYAQLHGGDDIPPGTTGSFYTYVQIFNFLQAAGPDLTPENMAAGVRSLPEMGAPDYPVGRWSWANSHTGVIDSREVYWDGNAPPAPNEHDQSLRGRWIATYDGRRFTNGEWPEEDPPVYPDRDRG